MLKSSNYNIFIDSKDSKDTIIYNSLYGSLAVFEPGHFAIVKQIINSPNSGDHKEIKKILKEQKFIINDKINEFSIIENRKRHGIKDKNRLDIVIMPTLECNFSCVYCYENIKGGTMTDITMESVKKWMTKEIPKYKLVMLLWYGGEPLLSINKILEITEHANKIASKKYIPVVRHITTNGYNFSKPVIKKLVDLGIVDYQVTIDGIPETHNKLRPLQNGKPTFDRIFKNIIELLKADGKVKITLRINFNHINLHEIPNLLKMFPEECRSQLRLSFEPIFGNYDICATDNISTDEISLSLAQYFEVAKELGYDVILGHSYVETGKLVYCHAERDNQFIINYNGDIYKCGVSDFNVSDRVGYLDEKGVFVKEVENFDKWINVPLFDTICDSCKYLPLCMGGCRKSRINNKSTGSFCTLVPTNASYVLKQISYQGFDNLVLDYHNSEIN